MFEQLALHFTSSRRIRGAGAGVRSTTTTSSSTTVRRHQRHQWVLFLCPTVYKEIERNRTRHLLVNFPPFGSMALRSFMAVFWGAECASIGTHEQQRRRRAEVGARKSQEVGPIKLTIPLTSSPFWLRLSLGRRLLSITILVHTPPPIPHSSGKDQWLINL